MSTDDSRGHIEMAWVTQRTVVTGVSYGGADITQERVNASHYLGEWSSDLSIQIAACWFHLMVLRVTLSSRLQEVKEPSAGRQKAEFKPAGDT